MSEFSPPSNITPDDGTCLFHFLLSIWRKAVNLDLKVPYIYIYIQNLDIRQGIQKLLALPFVPLQDLGNVFINLRDEIHDDVLELADYVDKTYVSGCPACGRRCTMPPRFEPRVWNVYALMLIVLQRAINIVEGGHSKFQKLLHRCHASV